MTRFSIQMVASGVRSEVTMTLVAMMAVADSATGANTGFASASAYGTATAAPAVDDAATPATPSPSQSDDRASIKRLPTE